MRVHEPKNMRGSLVHASLCACSAVGTRPLQSGHRHIPVTRYKFSSLGHVFMRKCVCFWGLLGLTGSPITCERSLKYIPDLGKFGTICSQQKTHKKGTHKHEMFLGRLEAQQESLVVFRAGDDYSWR